MYIVLLYVKYILLFIMTCIFIETRNFMFSFDKFLCGFINYDWLKTWFCLKKLLVISTFSFIHDNTSMKLKSYFFFSLEYVHKWYICDWISSVFNVLWFHIFFTFWMIGKLKCQCAFISWKITVHADECVLKVCSGNLVIYVK